VFDSIELLFAGVILWTMWEFFKIVEFENRMEEKYIALKKQENKQQRKNI
jgi:hypothetical protein